MLEKTIGAEVLGPIFGYFLHRLHQAIVSLEEIHGAKPLFAARAGIRIRDLYEAFLGEGEPPGGTHPVFGISRFMVAKGIWCRRPDLTLGILKKEFAHGTVGDVIGALLACEGGRPADGGGDDRLLGLPAAALDEAFARAHPAVEAARAHLTGQSVLFVEYVRSLLGSHRAALLIDSGWQGTSQLMLQAAFPDIEWWGGYFGRSFFPDSDRSQARRMLGLVFEADAFSPDCPESGIVLHRHLIEALLEPRAASVERLVRTPSGIQPPNMDELAGEAGRNDAPPLYGAVKAYVSGLQRRKPVAGLVRDFQAAAPRLARLLAFPSAEEARALSAFTRSADFGRTLSVPVLAAPDGGAQGHDGHPDAAAARMRDTLWVQGQIALEYPGDLVSAHQAQALGLKIRPHDLGRGCAGRPPRAAARPTVAVIMRTMDRVSFLRRALESVAAQTYRNYVLAVVCDGGGIEAVSRCIEQSGLDLRKVVLVDNVVNRGMEAASNIAIARTRSEYVVIHDDDDTWHPQFLERTVDFLESARGQNYLGVVTHSYYVSETVTPQGIVRLAERGYKDWFRTIQFSEMACENYFPPIAFLFRRSAYDRVGGFDESLPVLGDWEFNLSVLQEGDIGVIEEKLAYYHHRDSGTSQAFANSVFGETDKHAEFDAVVRNRFARRRGEGEASAASHLVSLNHLVSGLRTSLRKLEAAADGRRDAQTEAAGHLRRLQHDADTRWVQLHAAMQLAQSLRGDVAALRTRQDELQQGLCYAKDVVWTLASGTGAHARPAAAPKSGGEAGMPPARSGSDKVVDLVAAAGRKTGKREGETGVEKKRKPGPQRERGSAAV